MQVRRPRAIPLQDLALAYELRQEYKMHWKRIAQLLGCDSRALNQAVIRATKNGISNGSV